MLGCGLFPEPPIQMPDHHSPCQRFAHADDGLASAEDVHTSGTVSEERFSSKSSARADESLPNVGDVPTGEMTKAHSPCQLSPHADCHPR